MSVVSRILIAAAACASLATVAYADEAPSSGARLGHASKCVLTLGFGGDCDSKEPVSKAEKAKAAEAKAAKQAAVTKASVEAGPPSTRAEFFHASKCVVTLGFGGACDSKVPPPPSAERAETPPDTSTRGRFFHASKCVVTLGFGNRCDQGDAR